MPAEPTPADGPLFQAAHRRRRRGRQRDGRAAAARGVGGVALLIVARVRHWRFGVQWAVILGVIVLLAALMTIFWQGH